MKCDPGAKYRTTEGYCNNLKTPAWGRCNTAYRRLLKADYDDGEFIIIIFCKYCLKFLINIAKIIGLYALRGSSNEGRELPSARLVSTTVAEPMHIPDLTRTQAMAIWGLFIGYDMAYTPASNMGRLNNICIRYLPILRV